MDHEHDVVVVLAVAVSAHTHLLCRYAWPRIKHREAVSTWHHDCVSRTYSCTARNWLCDTSVCAHRNPCSGFNGQL